MVVGDRPAWSLMLGVGLVAAAASPTTNRTARASSASASRRSTLDEGVLYAQSLVLATTWPNAGANPVPRRAAPRRARPSDQLPERRDARRRDSGGPADFANVDQLRTARPGRRRCATTAARWRTPTTRCRPTRPRRATGLGTCAAPCTYDFNSDRELWVQAAGDRARQAAQRRRPLRLEQLTESVPQTGVVAGARLDHQQRQPRRHADHRRQRLGRCSCAAPNPSAADCVDCEDGQIVPGAAVDATAPNLMTRGAARALQAARDHRRPLLPGLPDQERQQRTTSRARSSGSRAARTRRTSPTRCRRWPATPRRRAWPGLHEHRRRTRAC